MQDVERVAEAIVWLEQDSSIHLKASSREGDPIELTADEARMLAKILNALAARLDTLDGE